jgi:hypothetical protein
MSVTGQTLSEFDQALRIDYLPVVREQLNNHSYLLTKVKRNERDVSGKQWMLTAHYKRNSGVGAGTETGLPTAGQQTYANPYGVVKYNRGRIQVSGPTIAASRNDKGAIVRALDSEIQGVTADLKNELDYQLHNDGTAVRCIINGDPGTDSTTTVDNPGTRYLYDGLPIDILDPATGDITTSGTGGTVSSITNETNFEYSTGHNADVADNDWIIRTGARKVGDGTLTTNVSYEMMGLKGIVDDSTYVTTLHNLSRASYTWWNCATFTSDDNSGTLRSLTIDLMQSAVSAVEKEGGQVDLILCDHALRDAYAALVVADKRHVNTMTLDGGFTALEFNGIPVVADSYMPNNTMFFISTPHLELMQMGDWDWMDKDGSVLARVSDYDAYEAVIYWYADLATDRPKYHSFLRDVQ